MTTAPTLKLLLKAFHLPAFVANYLMSGHI
jgi:hypothetical protein